MTQAHLSGQVTAPVFFMTSFMKVILSARMPVANEISCFAKSFAEAYPVTASIGTAPLVSKSGIEDKGRPCADPDSRTSLVDPAPHVRRRQLSAHQYPWSPSPAD